MKVELQNIFQKSTLTFKVGKIKSFFIIITSEEKLLVLKLDGLKKHNDKQMCKVDWPNKEVGKSYINFDRQLLKMKRFAP
jgi:hypothetical protein